MYLTARLTFEVPSGMPSGILNPTTSSASNGPRIAVEPDVPRVVDVHATFVAPVRSPTFPFVNVSVYSVSHARGSVGGVHVPAAEPQSLHPSLASG